jgi:hypothetical protein
MHPRLVAATLLLVSAPPLLSQGSPEVEPNDSSATATPINPGLQVDASIGRSGDVDFYFFTLTTARDVRALTSPGFGPDVGDTRLTLFAADGVTQLAFNDDAPGRGYYSEVTAGGLPPGIYFLEVAGAGPFTGSYTLDLYTTPPGDLVLLTGTLSPGLEAVEPNDPRLPGGVATPAAPFTRNAGTLIAGNCLYSFTGGADYDFFAFNVTSLGAHTVSTLATATLPQATACQDTCIWLVDANLNVLASNDDAGGAYWSQLTYNITAPGIYYAVVAAWGTPGIYLLDIIGQVPPLPSVTIASFAAQPGGCTGSAGRPRLDTRSDAVFGIHSELPLLGTQFFVDIDRVPPSAAVVCALGLSTLASPYDLAAIGAPGCQFEINAPSSTIGVADAAGVLFWSLRIPYNLGLRGLPLELQALVLDAGANAAGLSVSNRGSAVVGNGY